MEANNLYMERSIRASDLEKLTILAKVLAEPLDFKKKFRIVVEHDPEQVAVKVFYYS